MARGRGWLALCAWLAIPVAVHGQEPPGQDTTPSAVVRAVLFYSPTCPHCRDVIVNGLPPLHQRFGQQLVIVGVNVAAAGGWELYQAVVRQFALSAERQGVPTLVVGSRVLVGSLEIPAELPGIVVRGLAAGGVDWPEVPLLRQALAAQGLAPRRSAPAESLGQPHPPPAPNVGVSPAEAPAAAESAAPAPTAAVAPAVAPPARAAKAAPPISIGRQPPVPSARPTPPERARVAGDTAVPTGAVAVGVGDSLEPRAASPAERFLTDPVGNTAALGVLLLMIAGLAAALRATVARGSRFPQAPGWTIPMLAVIGAGVAAYLTFVEMTGARAVCGPVGDCNTVQQSEYARLLGVPIGLLGVGGYAAIIVAWVIAVTGGMAARNRAWLAIWGMALMATLFSAYLTFLEPFVIGATCAWCLSSAVIVTLILVAATPAAAPVVRSLTGGGPPGE
jgi:uncharacterized membrane protein